VAIDDAFGMLTAISFDDQPALLTHEVCNERANRLLSTKLDAV